MLETSYHVDRISTSVILVLEIDIRFEYQHNIKYHMFIVQVPHQFGAKERWFFFKKGRKLLAILHVMTNKS